jgi:hypothetical protein
LGSSFFSVFFNFYFFFIGTDIPLSYLFQTPVASQANIPIIMRTHVNTG